MISNIMQLLAVLLVFILVLFATYYVTKWVAKSGVVQSRTSNIKVVETFKIAQNKYLQIIQLGEKYYAIGVTKEQITFLTSLEEEQLDFSAPDNVSQQIPFKDLLSMFSKGKKAADGNSNKEK